LPGARPARVDRRPIDHGNQQAGEREIFMKGHLFVRFALATALTVAGGWNVQAQDARNDLAPTGKLRVGVYPGSPLSMVRDPKTGGTHGLSVDLGKVLAQRLGVPFELVSYQRIADVIDGMKSGAVDFTVSNASPARAQDVAFSPTLVSLELGYLVPTASPITTAAEIDTRGVRVGVTQGSTSERTLPRLLANATVVPATNLKVAIEMLARHELDAFATNKAILYEMSDEMGGARIVDGRWGVEHVAAAIPKGNERALDYIRRFVEEARTSGLVMRAAESAGLRGAVNAE
jgi:polar amino acid transport system substrate-binding protein